MTEDPLTDAQLPEERRMGVMPAGPISDGAVIPLNLSLVLHLFLVFVSLELFNAFDSVGADALGRLYVLSCLVPLVVLGMTLARPSLRSRQTLMPLAIFMGCLAVLFLFVALAPNGYNINPDVARYHAPRQLMQLISGDLSLYSSPKPEEIFSISFVDNYNMASFAAFRSHAFANVLNVLSFALIAYNSVYLIGKLRRGLTAGLLLVLLLFGMPIIFGEIFIAKNNIFSIYLFTVSCIGTLWIASRQTRRRSLMLFAGFQGAVFGLIFSTKATLAVALVGYVVLVCWFVARRYRPDWTTLGWALLTGGAVFAVVVSPYLLRLSMGLADAPSAARLDAWLDGWLFVPPRAQCGLYVWPQHFSTAVDAIATYLGHPFDANLSPDVCIRAENDRPLWNLQYYGEGIPIVVTAFGFGALLLAAIRRMWLELAVLGVAISSLVIHQMFYTNSVWNYRLVGITFFMLAIGVALTVGRLGVSWVKWLGIVVAGVWALFIVPQTWSVEHGLPDIYRNVRMFGAIEENGPVSVELHEGTNNSAYYALLTLLEQVDFEWERLSVVYGNEFGGMYYVDADDMSSAAPTHRVYCFDGQSLLTPSRLSEDFKSNVDTDQNGCHIVANGGPGGDA